MKKLFISLLLVLFLGTSAFARGPKPVYYGTTVAGFLSGTIDGVTIGGTTPAAGTFTTVDLDILKLDQNVEALSATKTLVVTDMVVQKLDPNGSDRDVNLPAEASSTDLTFIIFNTGDGAAETLTIKNDAPATLGTLEPEMVGVYHCDGTTWTGFKTLPDGDELLIDGVAGTVTIASLIATTADINAGTADALTSLTMADAAGPSLLNEAATATNPTLIPDRADPDTGIGWTAADQISIVAGGVAGLRVTESAGTITIDAYGTFSVPASATPSSTFEDSDATISDVHGKIYGDLTDTGDGTEDMDMFFQAMLAGSLTSFLEWDASLTNLDIVGSVASTPVTYTFTTEADITTILTTSVLLLDGDNDSENDTIDLQDGSVAGQVLHLIAAVDIDADDTCTISYADTTCTNCPATVFNKVGENVHLVWTGTTWVCVSLQDAL